MDSSDLKFWIALKFIEDAGSVTINKLIDHFGSPESVFRASVDEMVSVDGVSRLTAQRIHSFNDWHRVERELELAHKHNTTLITSSSLSYPPLLREIFDYPPLLYSKGTLADTGITVAVVGSRNATIYGKFITERLCRELVLRGVTIVSGMARGIDTAAHKGALSGGGKTIAVLGSGMNIAYPPENKLLLDEIALHGAVLTEFPFDTEPKAHHFPLRNRIISGLSHGVVVVEAHEKSGSLITARCALEQGREVFAIPGPIDSAASKGAHRLIRDGATLVETADDILEEILPQTGQITSMKIDDSENVQDESLGLLSDDERALLKAIAYQPIHVNDIIAKSGGNAHRILSILTHLELYGYISQHPGNTYARCK